MAVPTSAEAHRLLRLASITMNNFFPVRFLANPALSANPFLTTFGLARHIKWTYRSIHTNGNKRNKGWATRQLHSYVPRVAGHHSPILEHVLANKDRAFFHTFTASLLSSSVNLLLLHEKDEQSECAGTHTY